MSWPAELSPHFTLSELTRSDWAEEHGIPNDPPEALAGNAVRLCELAELARAALSAAAGRDVKMIPSNGYRSPAVNVGVGGSGARPGEKLSAHCDFRAIDFHVEGTNLATAFDVLRRSAIPFDKLIFEIDSHGATWLHLQVERAGEVPARRVLRGVKGPNGSTYRELPYV
jgi:hypothetical protein